MEMDFAASMAALHHEMMSGITRGLQHHEVQQQENARLERVKATLEAARLGIPTERQGCAANGDPSTS